MCVCAIQIKQGPTNRNIALQCYLWSKTPPGAFSLNMYSVCLYPVHVIYISTWTMNVCLGDIKLTWRWEDEENTNPHVWAVLGVTVCVSAWAHAGLQIVTLHGHLHSSAYLSEEGEMHPVKDEWWIKPDEWADVWPFVCSSVHFHTQLKNVRYMQ